MPQLDAHTFAPQLIWLAITFIALYLLMAKVGLPRVGRIIARRRERIEGDIAKAGQLKSEAEAVIAAYERALAEAREEAQRTMRETIERLNAAAAERQSKLAGQLAAETTTAERRINEARTAALANLGEMAAEVARATAVKLTGAEIDPARARVAVDAVLRERG
ncbi:MAG TPA: F0F1 ATP synthase subunit B' [Stellaceae bacterium]|nr:F0F1 ATP synthase subunit B' [Stellaceae bacterium]